MTEIEKVKSEIKVLEAKLSLLEEMENHKMTLKDEGKFYFVHHNDKLYHRMEYTHIPIVWWFENVNTFEHPVPMHRKVMDGELNKTLEQLYQEQIAVKETAQERGERVHKEVEELLNGEEYKLWKKERNKTEVLENLRNSLQEMANGELKPIDDIMEEVKKLQEKNWSYKITDEHGETNPYKQYLNSEKEWKPKPQEPEEQKFKEIPELLDQLDALSEFHPLPTAVWRDIRKLMFLSYDKGYSKGGYDTHMKYAGTD
jgi:hypothetical protein